MKNLGQHLIFEGAELAGKSFLLSQVFNYLEPKYNSGRRIMDGCHWFNLDVGLYGGPHGQQLINKFTELLLTLKESNVLLEKFHLTEAVYQKLYHGSDFDFQSIEKSLSSVATKIVLVTFDEDESLLKKRLADRLRLYPHYARIAQGPKDYIQQQRLYLDLSQKSALPLLKVNASVLPNKRLLDDILDFLGEN